MTALDIYADLRGEVCLCGERKAPGKSFCRRDYFRLPAEMRDRLYQRAGYPETFICAAQMLGLALREPAATQEGSGFL